MVSMPATKGTVVRPYGSDSYPPKPGTVVTWSAARAIREAAAASVAAGVVVYVIGNSDHLKRHGGHTPFRAGSKRGIVWSCDIMYHGPINAARARLLEVLKSDADTKWISFINLGNRQYSFSGADQGYSGDSHWHLEVRDGYENAATNAAELVTFVLTGKKPSAKAAAKPAQKPADKPSGETKEEVTPVLLVKLKSDDAVYKCNGFARVHILRPEYDRLVKAGVKVLVVPDGTNLDDFGKLEEEGK